MKMKQIVVLGALAVASVLVGACSSSSSNNGPGGAAGSCLASSNPSSTSGCNSCVETACSTQLSNVNSPCSDYLSCVCPGGTYSASASMSQTCVAKGQTQACGMALSSFVSCLTTNLAPGGSCASACTVSGDAGGTTPDAGSTDQ
jgi:hypothetical protein